MVKNNLGRRILSILLMPLLLLVLFTSAGATQLDMQELSISENAGANGYYKYDASTGLAEFISATGSMNQEIMPVPAICTSAEYENISPYIVVGDDNRVPVTNIAATGIYASTCLLISVWGDNSSTATGWLLNDTYVMTAGHVLYEPDKGWADYIQVLVGATGGTWFESCKGYPVYAGAEYVNSTRDDYSTKGVFDDWGIIELEHPLKVSIGYLGRNIVRSASDMQDFLYYTQGYPGDRNEGVIAYNRTMFCTVGRVTSDHSRSIPVVNTDLDVTAGQSGSPVYRYMSGYGYTVEAIIVAENNSENQNRLILFNDYLHNLVNNLTG